MNQNILFGESELSALRETVVAQISPKRFTHTAAVEDMVVRLASLYCPEEILSLRAAALLHDVTKEYDIPTQMAILRGTGEELRPGDEFSHKTFHARTAAALIAAEYPTFADSTIVDAVRWHTTGRVGMTLTEQLLYLADYIDASRTFHSCVVLRRYFWGAVPEKMTAEDRLRLLRETLSFSFDLTMRDLLDDGALIAKETVEARNELRLLLKE